MGDFKSKLPDLQELGSMTGKLFHDVKTSVCGIIDEYKKKRATAEPPPAEKKVKTASPKKEGVKKEKPAKSVKETDKGEKAE